MHIEKQVCRNCKKMDNQDKLKFTENNKEEKVKSAEIAEEMIQTTKNWLKGNHILVNDDWLGACVEWIQEENQGNTLTDDDLNGQVYEQWLLADLHELETTCLPADAATLPKYELSGAYALQIDSIVDVGVSFYSQQQKLKGTENENARVNADEPTRKPWEAKPSRMLMFALTDGQHNVQGMEYRPISCLSPQTSPGAKVLIHGNVLCRRGVLMLSDSNIRFLGGEVDTLLEANTLLNNLQSAMEASEEHSGKEHKQTYAGTRIKNNNQAMRGNQPNSGYQPGNTNTGQQGSKWSHVKNTTIKKEVKSEPISQSINPQSHLVDNMNLAEYEGFFEDDMDAFPDEMDFEQSQPVRSSSTNSRLQNTNAKTQNVTSVTCKVDRTNQKTSTTSYNYPMQTSVNNQSRNTISKPSKYNVNQNIDDFDGMDFDDDDDDFSLLDDKALIASNNANNQPCAKNSNSVGNLKSDYRPSSNNTYNQSCVKNSNNLSNIKSDNGSRDETETVSNSAKVNKRKSMIEFAKNDANECVGKTVVKSELSNKVPKLENAGKLSINSLKNIKEKQRSIVKFCTVKKEESCEEQGTTSEVCGQEIQTEYPLTYLAQLMSKPAPEQPTKHTVKAYISTLTSKLTSANERWSLTCKINDGTMSVDVDLSNQVLTQLIGFSAKQAQEMKLRLKTDPGIKEVIKEGIQQCQQKLIELVGLLELEICARHPRPVIVATKQHIDL